MSKGAQSEVDEDLNICLIKPVSAGLVICWGCRYC